jgi:hypothetical protein
MNSKFPFEVKLEPTKTDAILSGLLVRRQIRDGVFVLTWAVMALVQ